jgi:hypothetical protein
MRASNKMLELARLTENLDAVSDGKIRDSTF